MAQLYSSPSNSDEEDNTANDTPSKEDDCCICLQPLDKPSIPITLPCKHSGHYNCLMGVRNGLCPLCRSPIPKNLAKKVEIDYDPQEGQNMPLWLYGSRDNTTWWYFQAEHSEIMEAGYQKYEESNHNPQHTEIQLLIRGQLYVINFSRMKQKSPNGVERTIKRRKPHEEPEGIRGIAGAVPKDA